MLSDVEYFIEEMYNHFADDKEKQEWLRVHYKYGYCYYFAHMLKTAFNRGQVCWTAPYEHWIFLDEDNTPYDCEGKFKGERFYFIPERYVPTSIVEWYKHKNRNVKAPSRDFIIDRIKSYCKLVKEPYNPEIEKHIYDED